jgi:NAD(P) transhydrogenase subunit alpha
MDGSFVTVAQADPGGAAIADAIGNAVEAATAGGVDPFFFQLSIFVLAIFVGYYVVWSVTPALHTPLMSVTNAISSVIVVGALLAVGTEVAPLLAGLGEGGSPGLARVFGSVALAIVAINIVGGFMVTQRMLSLYKKKPKAGQN